MAGENELDHLIDGDIPQAICPYCDKSISGEFEKYGGMLLHPDCYADFGNDLREVSKSPRFVLTNA